VEKRQAPAAGSGIRRWHQMARALADCRAVLVGGIGTAPREVLEAAGFRVVVAAGFIEDGLRVVYENRPGDALKGRRQPVAAGRCSGSGGGCGG
jgi:nitrogen fixation protein NifB